MLHPQREELTSTYKFSILQTAVAGWFITGLVTGIASSGKWSWHHESEFKDHLVLKSYDLVLGSSVRSRELDSIIRMTSFQLKIFYDSVLVAKDNPDLKPIPSHRKSH